MQPFAYASKPGSMCVRYSNSLKPRAIDRPRADGSEAMQRAQQAGGPRGTADPPAGTALEWCYFTENVSPVVNRCTRGVDSSRWTKNVR
jgi:hypothetical protein